MFCTKCGNPIKAGAAVCSKCGLRLDTQSASVPNHLVGAIASTLFCCPLTGIVAIVYACRVNTKLAQGDRTGAQEASKLAYRWMLAGVALGVVLVCVNAVLRMMESLN